nr:DUF3592 domain-containing protein [Crossiella equi]
MLLTGVAMLIGLMAGAVALEDRYLDLEANGKQVAGTVVEVHAGYRGTGDAVEVRFTVDGIPRVRSLNLDDTSPRYSAGDPITVLQDPADPERIAAPGVSNDPGWATLLMVLAVVLVVMLIPVGLAELFRRRVP